MTILTGCRKSRRTVVGIGCGVVIRRVTTITCIRRVVVIAVVTGCAIVRDRRVRSVQYVVIVVDRECRRRPTGFCGVAHRAIRRQVQRRVARIGALAVIRAVATVARVRRVRVIAVVARVAIARYRYVRTSEGIDGVVVKRRRHPSCLRVAQGTIRRKLRCRVVRHRRLRIIVCVTTVTGVRRVGIVPVVTRCAIV